MALSLVTIISLLSLLIAYFLEPWMWDAKKKNKERRN